MSNFFQTGSVSMFPSSYRRADTKGKYTSEENFVNIINSIVDRDCYVLSTESSLANGDPLKVVLHGYYFEVDEFSLSSYPNFYVAIRVEQGASAIVNFDTGSSTDEQIDLNGDFRGLAYSTSDFSGLVDDNDYKYYTLRVSNGGSLVNKVRLSSDSVYYGSSENSVSQALDGKQDSLEAGLGIDSNKLDQNEISLTDGYNTLLNSMASKTVGATDTPIYISGGEAKAITGNSGKTFTTSGNYSYVQAALISSGKLQSNGVQLFASTDNPDNSIGQNGDFWFKYESSN